MTNHESGCYASTMSPNPTFPTAEDVRDYVLDGYIDQSNLINPRVSLPERLSNPTVAAIYYRDQVMAMKLFEWLERRHRSVTDHFHKSIEEHLAVRTAATDRAVAAEQRAALADEWMEKAGANMKRLEELVASERLRMGEELDRERHRADESSEIAGANLQMRDEARSHEVEAQSRAFRMSSRCSELLNLIERLLAMLPPKQRRKPRAELHRILNPVPTPQPNPPLQPKEQS